MEYVGEPAFLDSSKKSGDDDVETEEPFVSTRTFFIMFFMVVFFFLLTGFIYDALVETYKEITGQKKISAIEFFIISFILTLLFILVLKLWIKRPLKSTF